MEVIFTRSKWFMLMDTLVKGGDLAYSTAQGLNAEDINIDGDGFVTEIRLLKDRRSLCQDKY
jgi:hypothetical protein